MLPRRPWIATRLARADARRLLRCGDPPPETGPSMNDTQNGASVQTVSDHFYFNRELSWLAFNQRVLDQAADPDWPLLERVKFLAIFGSNLDEFFMIRVSGLHEQLESGVIERTPDGLSASEQLARIGEVVRRDIAR